MAENGRDMTVSGRPPVRMRFAVLLTVIPPIAGVATVIPLWGTHGKPDFFLAATHVLALGAIALAIQGRFFRLRPHVEGGTAGIYSMLNIITILVATGIGLGFAFGALANDKPGDAHLALVSGALATGVAAFAVQALFGTPGAADDD